MTLWRYGVNFIRNRDSEIDPLEGRLRFLGKRYQLRKNSEIVNHLFTVTKAKTALLKRMLKRGPLHPVNYREITDLNINILWYYQAFAQFIPHDSSPSPSHLDWSADLLTDGNYSINSVPELDRSLDGRYFAFLDFLGQINVVDLRRIPDAAGIRNLPRFEPKLPFIDYRWKNIYGQAFSLRDVVVGAHFSPDNKFLLALKDNSSLRDSNGFGPFKGDRTLRLYEVGSDKFVDLFSGEVRREILDPKKLPSDYSERDPGLFENSPKIKYFGFSDDAESFFIWSDRLCIYNLENFVPELSLSQLASILPMIQKRALQVAKPYSTY